MKSAVYTTLLTEYTSGVLMIPEEIVPIIHMLEGECTPFEDNKFEESLLVIEGLLKQYDDLHPNAWSDVSLYQNGDIFDLYTGFGEDKKVVSFMDAIRQQIENILALHKIKSYICQSLKK